MVEEEENPNSMYIVPDLLEQIFLRLPLKSILKFRTVSKQWRSILRSKRFVKKHKSIQKTHRKILASYDCDCGGKPSLLPESRFEGDEEIVYLHCNASRPSMTCDGLVCFPEQDWFVVLNPLTRQIQRFSSGLNSRNRFGFGLRSMRFCPEKWAMGFGRDKVKGRYKVVRMCFYFWERRGQRDPVVECGVLDVDTGEWRKLNPPRHVVNAGSKSVCVNGSIYWLQIGTGFKILALDLDKEKFHGVPGPGPATSVTRVTQIVNLEDRLAIATTKVKFGCEWVLEISIMDTEEKLWSKAYSISLAHRVVSLERWKRWFTPVAVSKQGNLVFCDNQKRLFKYYPRKDEIRCLSLDTCVISSYVENVGTLALIPSHPYPRPVSLDSKTRVVSRCPLLPREPSSWLSKVLQWNEFRILDILFASLVVAGYIFSPH